MEDRPRTKSLSERKLLSDSFKWDIDLFLLFGLEMKSCLSLGFEPAGLRTEIHTIDSPGSLVCQLQILGILSLHIVWANPLQ